MTWEEKRMLNSKRESKNSVKNDVGSLGRHCLGCYIEKAAEQECMSSGGEA